MIFVKLLNTFEPYLTFFLMLFFKDWLSLSLLMLPHVNNDTFMVLKPFP